jgi:hypothetical protein
MNKPQDYIYIRKWGAIMGSYEYYIKAQQRQAAEDDAPLNAVYQILPKEGVRSHEWATTDDITRPINRERLGLEDDTEVTA